MARTKISEFSSTPANNTDIDSINIAEGCAPSNINDAIRELMAQLKDFQIGSQGDSFNGPIGTTTAAAGAFTTLSASSTVTLSGGTANGVTYLNGSKVLTSGSALVFNGSTLGVGIPSPAGVLAISSGTTDTRLWIQNTTSGTASGDGLGLLMINSDAYMFNYEGPVIFGASGFEGMRLTSTGLGIGTSSPATPLDVVANSSSFGISLRGRSADNIGTFGFYTNNGATNDAQIQMRPSDNEFRFLVSGSRSQTFYTNGSERMRLDSAGNLGLGVTPYAWSGGRAFDLQLYGTLNTWDDGSLAMTQLGTNYYQTGSTFNYKVGSTAAMYRLRGNVHSWHTAPSGTAGNAITFTQAMTLLANGSLCVGTTTQLNGGSLNIYGAATSAPLANFFSSTAGDVGNAILNLSKQDNNTTTSQVFLRCGIASTGAGAGQINMNGANSLAFGTFSDARLKENIVNLPPQLENILALRPVEFDYIQSEGGGHQTGFIAQEMQQVYSDAVGEREDGMLTVSGWDKTTARLVKAIQEQQAIIESLKARLDAANL